MQMHPRGCAFGSDCAPGLKGEGGSHRCPTPEAVLLDRTVPLG